jgi:hypothetical protein
LGWGRGGMGMLVVISLRVGGSFRVGIVWFGNDWIVTDVK